jgi:hypothetical protein
VEKVNVKHAAVLVLAACLVGMVAGSALTLAVLQRSLSISNVAQVRAVGVEVYEDQALNVPLTRIDWGLLSPGETKTFNTYIRNSGNTPITLSLSTENWSPSNASSAISVGWNYSNSTIAARAALAVTFELTVSPTITGVDAFSFTMVITGTG